MCGILGLVSNRLEQRRESYNKAFGALAHRGPHGSATVEIQLNSQGSPSILLGHHRLAIVDLTTKANQPLSSKKGSIIVVNGEIYNSIELRARLRERFEFQTNSDSEVALAVLECFGPQGVSLLDGMFSFAFLSADRENVILGRDRLGIKPLYFSKTGNDIWFSSEARSLAIALNVSLDLIGLAEWSQYQFQVSHRTFFNNIHTVEPGNVVILKNGLLKSRRYWSFDEQLAKRDIHRGSLQDAEFYLREKVLSAVQKHLMSDVEVATIVSGGMDSSSVACVASKLGVTNAYVGRYDVPEYDETFFSRIVAEHCNLDLHIVDISATDFLENIPKVAKSLDFPTAGPGAVGQYIVSGNINQRVVLAGTGGDELFLGYTRDSFPLWAAGLYSQPSSSATPPLLQGYEKMFERFLAADGLNSPLSGFMATIERTGTQKSLFSISRARRNAVRAELQAYISPSGGEALEEVHDSLLRYEMTRFLQSLLHVEDRMTMTHGIESRVPLLDLSLMEFILSLPLEYRMSGNYPKDLLRRAMTGIVPEPILSRTDKKGFPVPIRFWVNSNPTFRGTIMELFDSLREREIPGLEITIPQSSDAIDQMSDRELWAGILFEYWYQQFQKEIRSVP